MSGFLAGGSLEHTLGRGLCSPTVVGIILSLVAVFAAYKGGYSATAYQMGAAAPSPGKLAIGLAVWCGLMWGLCYYGLSGAAWFFALAPLVAGGLEAYHHSK
jgi:hypothetical protein